MRKTKKIIALLLSLTMIVGTADGLFSLGKAKAAEEVGTSDALSKYLNIYEDFESYELNATDYLGSFHEPIYGAAGTSVIEADTDGGKWLKITSNDGVNTAGHMYSDPRADFSGAIDDHDGIAAYVSTEAAVTFNFMFGRNGLARTRTQTNGDLDYTLVTKDGKKSIGKAANGVPLSAGFEGWVIIGYEELTGADGWKEALAYLRGEGGTLSNVNYMACEISDASSVVYVDNIAFVKNCDSFISYVAPPSVYDFLNVYEGFDGYELGNTYTLDTQTDYGTTQATATILEKDITKNRWLKLGNEQGSGDNTYAHQYSPANIARTDFTGKVDAYNGMAVYVRTESAATFNLLMYSNAGNGRTRTATNATLDYTLITKDGEKIVGTGAFGIPLTAGFEGWLIIGYEELTAAGGYPSTAFDPITSNQYWNNDLAFIELMGVEITNSTAPVYVDDISFVTNTAEMIEFLAPTVITAEDYLTVYEDFDAYNSMSDYALDFTDVNDNLNGTVSIETKSEGDKWIKFTGRNELGHKYPNPRTDIGGAASEYDGAAVYVKAEKAADIGILLKSTGLTRTTFHANVPATLISASGVVTSITSNASGFPIPEGFEGWLVVEKDNLSDAGGWEGYGAFDSNTTNINQIWVYQLDVLNTDGAVYADNFSFVKDTTEFIDRLRVTYPAEYVKYYETFNGYAEGKGTYALNDNGNDFFDVKTDAEATVETRGEGDKWLKVSGNNNVGHIYGVDSDGNSAYGWARNDFSANPADYQGISLEVKTEFSAKLNLRFRQTYGIPGGNQGLNRTAMNSAVSYTLISKDGQVTKKTEANGMTIPAGFEGTIVLDKAMATAHTGYADLWACYESTEVQEDAKDLKWLNEFAVEITETTGAVYLDKYAFITDVEAYIDAFKNVSYVYETGDISEDHSIDSYDVKLQRNELVRSDKKMLRLDQNNAWSVPMVNGRNLFNPNDYNGFAMYIRTNAEVPNYNIALYYNTGEGGRCLRTGYVNGTWTPDEISYTLISKHGTVISKTQTGTMTIPAHFEGWLVFGTDEIQAASGWDGSALTAMTDAGQFTRFTPIIENSTSLEFGVGSVVFLKDKAQFIEAKTAQQGISGELGILEDFENWENGEVALVDDGINPSLAANAEVGYYGSYAEEVYDVTGDGVLDARDLVRLKRLQSGEYTAPVSVFAASDLVQNMAVWNTPGLAANKEFQFDLDAESTWGSVSNDRNYYLTSLAYHDVGEIETLLPSVKAGEWGYALTHLDDEKDGAGNTIDNLGYTDTNKPSNDADAVTKMETFIKTQWGIDENTEWYSMNGYYPWYHYAAEFGASAILTEIGESLNNYQMHTAFTRGAGRQYNLPWGVDFSMWHDGYMHNPNGYDGWNKTGFLVNTDTDENSGHSLSLLERSLLMGYMSGANSLVAEAGGALSISKNDSDGDGYLDLTDYGKTVKKVYQFTEKTDTGTAYTPIGIVLDYYHGSYAGITESISYNSEDEKTFYTFDYTAGDSMTKSVAEMIWGSQAWVSGSTREGYKEEFAMVNNEEYGDSFDILLQNASLDVLKSYPVLLLSGDVQLSEEEVLNYKQYVNDGGTLLLNQAYITQFEVFMETMPYGDGEVIVYGNSAYDITGLDAIVKEQIAKYQPVSVSGDIQHITSVKDDTVYVTLINNNGVTKTGKDAAKTTASAEVSVTVTYEGSHNVSAVSDVYNSNDVNVSGQSATVTVPAGGIAVLEIKLM